MTKNQIKEILESIIDNSLPMDGEQTMTQVQLTELTDALASEGLDTVNPNGPCYPSTPR